VGGGTEEHIGKLHPTVAGGTKKATCGGRKRPDVKERRRTLGENSGPDRGVVATRKGTWGGRSSERSWEDVKEGGEKKFGLLVGRY